jgi:hypothetical protein
MTDSKSHEMTDAPKELEQIDTFNQFMVCGVRGGLQIDVGRRISPNEALNLAAWLVALAEPDADHEFSAVLEAVRNC